MGQFSNKRMASICTETFAVVIQVNACPIQDISPRDRDIDSVNANKEMCIAFPLLYLIHTKKEGAKETLKMSGEMIKNF